MNPFQAEIPDDWTGQYVNLCVLWPDSTDWRAILRGLLISPNDRGFWDDNTGNPSDAQVAIMSTFDVNLHVEECVMIPVGVIVPFAGDSPPIGWLMCDGAPVSRDDFGALFWAIGTAYGIGDGVTTFNVPDLRGSVPVGQLGNWPAFDALGKSGGEREHTLVVAEMPNHNHNQNPHNHAQSTHAHVAPMYNRTAVLSGNAGFPEAADPTAGAIASPNTSSVVAVNLEATGTNVAFGGSASHNNVQPFLVTHYIIKA